MKSTVRTSGAGPQAAVSDRQAVGSGSQYIRLMQVSIRHTFYNASGDLCSDFRIVPTAASRTLMASLGLLWQNDVSGFSILLDTHKQANFLNYLQMQAARAFSEEVSLWPHLACTLASQNPYFVNFTDMPIDSCPAVATYYLSNTTAVAIGAGIAQLAPKGVTNLPTLPRTGSAARHALPASLANAPMFLIDLLPARPPAVLGGVYPVDLDAGTVDPVQYLLEFQYRSTFWNYYVLSLGKPLSGLEIVPVDTSIPLVWFPRPHRVTLPDGQTGTRFVSDQVLPLQERSSCNFQLHGSAGGQKTKNGVLMNRLPVASIRQVIPGQSSFATNDQSQSSGRPFTGVDQPIYSDIYVYI